MPWRTGTVMLLAAVGLIVAGCIEKNPEHPARKARADRRISEDVAKTAPSTTRPVPGTGAGTGTVPTQAQH